MGNGFYEGAVWNEVPDSILLKIFSFLESTELVAASNLSHQWLRVSRDKLLWRHRIVVDFKLNTRQHSNVQVDVSSLDSGLDDYKRLIYDTPRLHCQTLREHKDEVLHVAFSPDGKLFASTSKDGTLKVWSSDHPCGLVAEKNLIEMFRWKYTQFSQFNKDGNLILVSGVHRTSVTLNGEIAVFEIDGSELNFRCRVLNKPYDVFGCWYDDQHILNGELHMLGHLVTCSDIWLCKASQDTHTERTAVLAPLFKFLNKNGSTIRTVLVSDYVSPAVRLAILEMKMRNRPQDLSRSRSGNMAELKKFLWDEQLWPPAVVADETDGVGSSGANATLLGPFGNGGIVESQQSPLGQCDHCQWNHVDSMSSSKLNASVKEAYGVSSSSATAGNCDCVCHGLMSDKLLIFTTGTLTYTPHEVGFKLIEGKDMLKRLNAEVMPPERLQEVNEMLRRTREHRERERAAAAASTAAPAAERVEWAAGVAEEEEPQQPAQFDMSRFDQPDHKIDLRGHIVGMALSHDQKRLFVNLREWPPGSVISDPLVPPPIAQQMEICVIDLEHLCLLSRRYYGHRAYTPNDDCFFIFMNASQQYIASGSEDKKGYVWDQTYGCLVASLSHDNVVNCLAFNPTDPEMLVSVSDDHTVNVWRSRRQLQQLGIAAISQCD